MFARKAAKRAPAVAAAMAPRRPAGTREERPRIPARLAGVPAFPPATAARFDRGRPGARPPATTPPVPAEAQPAPGQPPPRQIFLHHVVLPGGSPPTSAEVLHADVVWRQCSVRIIYSGTTRWTTDVLDQQPPAGDLNMAEYDRGVTEEEATILDYRPGGPLTLHAYHVPRFYPQHFSTMRGRAYSPALAGVDPAVILANDRVIDTLAHEIGHVILRQGGHSGDPSNLMATGDDRNGDDLLTEPQCGRARAS